MGRPARVTDYSLRDVGKLLGLPRSVVNGLIEAGFVSPARGRRREYRFSFHDLVLLRAAQGLADARIPSATILRSLRRLRTQLPEQIPMTGLRIEAVGDAVVVSEGDAQWRPDNGQYVLRFQVATPGGRLAIFGPARPVRTRCDAALQPGGPSGGPSAAAARDRQLSRSARRRSGSCRRALQPRTPVRSERIEARGGAALERVSQIDGRRAEVAVSEPTSSCRLVIAGNLRIPVGEASIRVVLPRPDMQFVERRQPVAVRRADVVRQMSVQRRRAPIRM